jgi:sRNA-binding protein
MRTYRYSREESEAVIRLLAEKYPKCFFENPRIRRPLKPNILVDLERDGFPAAHDQITAALDWYRSHFGYLYALQAGAKRIDLDGKEVDTVTEVEQNAAQKKIQEGQKLVSERNEHNAAKTLMALHAAGRIPDDQLRKLEAPSMTAKAKAPPTPPELMRLHEAVAAADAAWTGPGDAILRAALTSAALGIVIKEAQSVINSLAS